MSVADIQKEVAPILRKYGVRRASVFGSASRGEDTSQSDIDILVAIGRPMGLFTFLKMKREMERTLGRKVDIITENSVDKFIRPHIVKDLRVIYGEK